MPPWLGVWIPPWLCVCGVCALFCSCTGFSFSPKTWLVESVSLNLQLCVIYMIVYAYAMQKFYAARQNVSPHPYIFTYFKGPCQVLGPLNLPWYPCPAVDWHPIQDALWLVPSAFWAKLLAHFESVLDEWKHTDIAAILLWIIIG